MICVRNAGKRARDEDPLSVLRRYDLAVHGRRDVGLTGIYASAPSTTRMVTNGCAHLALCDMRRQYNAEAELAEPRSHVQEGRKKEKNTAASPATVTYPAYFINPTTHDSVQQVYSLLRGKENTILARILVGLKASLSSI